MIYKFKSQAEGDVIMLEANGDQMLTIIGKQPSTQGIITVDQMPKAIAAIETAVKNYEKNLEQERKNHVDTQLASDREFEHLGVWPAPFIEMLHGCEKAKKDIVWGV